MRLLFGLVALLTLSGAAAAGLPTVGEYVSDRPVVLCDTKEQVDTIIAAGRTDGDGVTEAYKKLSLIPDQWGELTCAIVPSQSHATILRVTAPVNFFAAEGTPAVAITAEIRGESPGRTLWFIYMLAPDEAAAPVPADHDDVRAIVF